MILFEKFGQHQPLNRQSERYRREGIDLSVSTLADQVGACTTTLRPYQLRKPIVVHPTKRADLSRHGYRAAQFEDAFARFLPPEPNIRTLKRGGGEKT